MRPMLLFFTVTLATSLCSCENCGPIAEPILNLYFGDGTGTKTPFDTLYALNSRGPILNRPTLSNQLALPINLGADSTRYVFRLAGRQDTVTVHYRRMFAYRNQKCGYVVNLLEPNAPQPKARTTRGTVVSVSYIQNRDGSFGASASNTGIYLSIQL